MSAIIGRYRPAEKAYGEWAFRWLYPERYPHSRHHLADQLAAIRQKHGAHEAREFRNYVLWLGVYPVKRRSH